MIQYGRWISDTRQAVNQFVADMGTAGASKVDWFAVMQAWIGTFGTPGDVTNALLTSGKAILDAVSGSSEGLSLAELVHRENAALQILSDKTADVNSDLAIYVACAERRLRRRQAAERVAAQHPARRQVRRRNADMGAQGLDVGGPCPSREAGATRHTSRDWEAKRATRPSSSRGRPRDGSP
jgi:hypothetical protein